MDHGWPFEPSSSLIETDRAVSRQNPSPGRVIARATAVMRSIVPSRETTPTTRRGGDGSPCEMPAPSETTTDTRKTRFGTTTTRIEASWPNVSTSGSRCPSRDWMPSIGGRGEERLDAPTRAPGRRPREPSFPSSPGKSLQMSSTHRVASGGDQRGWNHDRSIGSAPVLAPDAIAQPAHICVEHILTGWPRRVCSFLYLNRCLNFQVVTWLGRWRRSATRHVPFEYPRHLQRFP